MSIFPLPQFEADVEAERQDREAYERLKPPSTIVVRFGAMRLVGEFPYKGDAKPGCGSKLVVRTFRGIEIGEMLTSTCPNAGCSKSVTRKEMLEYIDNSGGKDYPFYTDGKVLRVATVDDLNDQRRIESQRLDMRKRAQALADEQRLEMKIVEAEPILGGDRLTFYFTSEERIDFRQLVQELAREFSTRIEMRQIGARDEARLTADYERCGQHCCCRQFLKVLKPVSMRSAKTQKASLDPLKISGRCGRLMCCLRYEDQTYEELKKRLPKRKARLGSPYGIGIVIDKQILTQLVQLRLEKDDSIVAVAVEDLCKPEEVEQKMAEGADAMRGMGDDDAKRRSSKSKGARSRRQDEHRKRSGADEDQPSQEGAPAKKKRRRRRRRRKGGDGDGASDQSRGRDDKGAPPPPPPPGAQGDGSSGADQQGGGGGKKRRRRRRGGRRRRGSGGGDGSGSGGGGGSSGSGGGGEG